jgi:hypothetical protein
VEGGWVAVAAVGGSRYWRGQAGKRRKPFFFEKKNQKTFVFCYQTLFEIGSIRAASTE